MACGVRHTVCKSVTMPELLVVLLCVVKPARHHCSSAQSITAAVFVAEVSLAPVTVFKADLPVYTSSSFPSRIVIKGLTIFFDNVRKLLF